MLHTFLGGAVEDVKKIVYDPFREYLRSAIDLEQLAAQGGGVISGATVLLVKGARGYFYALGTSRGCHGV